MQDGFHDKNKQSWNVLLPHQHYDGIYEYYEYLHDWLFIIQSWLITLNRELNLLVFRYLLYEH